MKLPYDRLIALLIVVLVQTHPLRGQFYKLNDDEREIYLQVERESDLVEFSGNVLQDSVQTMQVNNVLRNLVTRGTPYSSLLFKAVILRSPVPNAFSLANGRVYVTTGLLSHCITEDELASILAHEIGHVVNKHLYKKISNARSTLDSRAGAAMLGFGILLQSEFMVTMVPAITALSLGGYSRELESEADRFALTMVANLGYDPWDAVRVMERIRELERDTTNKNKWARKKGGRKEDTPFYVRTQPSISDRIDAFTAMIKTERIDPAAWAKQVSFAGRFYHSLLENSRLCLQLRELENAMPALSRAIAGSPRNVEGYFLAGEYFRLQGDSSSLKSALTYYQRTMRIDSTHAGAYRGFGIVSLKLGAVEDVSWAFQRYLELKPDAEDRKFVDHYLERQ